MTKRRRKVAVRAARRRGASPGLAPLAMRAALAPRASNAEHGRAPAPSAECLSQVAFACAELTLGYSVVARVAHEALVAEGAAALAALHRAVLDDVAKLCVTHGHAVPRTKSTCRDRLRWEWLASSARLIDGAPTARLMGECARLERLARAAASAHPALAHVRAALEVTRAGVETWSSWLRHP